MIIIPLIPGIRESPEMIKRYLLDRKASESDSFISNKPFCPRFLYRREQKTLPIVIFSFDDRGNALTAADTRIGATVSSTFRLEDTS